ncbi:MAG: DUF3341 domain-containing protein [Longimicrobiaceae bacterium]
MFGRKRPPSGVLGLFPYLDAASEAIRRLKHEGYELTVYSPTPRHELEEALETPESSIRLYTLVGGLTGAAAGTWIAVWTSLDWPLIVGGKEIVSMPAFVVIIFESAILIGALATVAGILLTSKLPRVGRNGGSFHPSLSAGSFGVYAHVPPELFDQVRRVMSESGCEQVVVDE